MKVVDSAWTPSGESGRITLDNGAKVYWTVDAPYYILHADGRKTREWSFNRFVNPASLSPEAEFMDTEPDCSHVQRTATAEETEEILGVVYGQESWWGK